MSIDFRNGVIKLHDVAGVYYSGQLLSGSVSFELDQPLSFSVLSIRYHGEANVLWTETEREVVNGVERDYTINYEGHEDYFDYTENLIGGAGTSQLPAGSHDIPFQFRIPSISPSSFKGSKGRVQYSVTATMTYLDPLASQHELMKEFDVIAPFDLNEGDPSMKQPISMEFEEVYGCNCFCNSSPVSVRVQLPVRGYCPGQLVPIAMDVQNDSNLEITKMKFEITTKECYRSKQPVSEYIPAERVIAKLKKGAVMANTKGQFTCELRVPDMVAPNLENCGIIDVRYFFRITIKLSGCNEAMQDESEIYIGLLPLKEFTPGEYIHPLVHVLPNSPLPVPTTGPISPAYPQPKIHTEPVTSPMQPPQVNKFNPLQSAPYPNYGSPYPSDNPPYPLENKPQIPTEQKPAPFRDYEIGFKAPERLSDGNPPYPDVGMPGTNPPYPRENLMPSVLPPYPTSNLMPQANPPPYSNGSFAPSAPMP